MSEPVYHTSTVTVVILFFVLLALIGALFILYKQLNKEANDEYTIQRLVYQQGGLRDHVRGAISVLESRLGVRLWPRNDSDGEGEEMQEIQGEGGQVDEVSSLISQSERDEEEDDNLARVQVDDASDKASSGGSDTGIEAQKRQEDSETITVLDQDSGGAGIVISLNQFSGNAIWSDEQDGDGNVTVL